MQSTLLRMAPLCLLAVSLSAQTRSPSSDTDEKFSPVLRLDYAHFDPRVEVPEPFPTLRADQDVQLWIVQFDGAPTEAGRQALRDAGAEVFGYLPDTAHVVRMDAATATAVTSVAGIRWVGAYEPAYRLEPLLRVELREGELDTSRRYNIVVVDRANDKPALAAAIRALGGVVDHEQPGSILFQATLTGAQLQKVARLDQVLWIDRWSPPELDMDNARNQGGGNYVETFGGFTGAGVIGHVYEGVDAAHYDFTNTPTAIGSCASAQTHGHATAGIVYGNGGSASQARGMAPDASFFYTNYSCVNAGTSRFQVVQDLVTLHDVMLTTASWGDARTTQYTSVSADSDDIVFAHDITWTQSQSNSSNQDSRPQAWAKNVFSVGGVAHRNNDDRSDDSWAAGGGSTGPAADGRIKPEIAAYYDNIWTSDRLGSAGYSSGDSTQTFGGTSGATPIVSGHNALVIQMYTDGLFGPVRNPGGSRFSNKPHFTTVKALMVANARQYEFNAGSTDNRREHVGFGFPDLRTMFNNAARMMVVDETDLLSQGQTNSYNVTVLPGDPELKIAMNYADPAANPAASLTRINDLDLRVVAPDGTIYHGNNGLWTGNASTSGGSANGIDTLECVMLTDPMPGTWVVEVSAPLVAQDSHVETPAVDADYALVVSFGLRTGSITEYGAACDGSVTRAPVCGSINAQGGTSANDTNTNEYAYPVQVSGGSAVGFEVFTRSRTGASTSVTARLYGPGPSTAPLSTTTFTVGTADGFYGGTFPAPVGLSAGTYYVGIDHTTATSVLANLQSGTFARGYYRTTAASGNWTQSGVIDYPSATLLCAGVAAQVPPTFQVDGTPAIGGTLVGTVTDTAPNALATVAIGFSDTSIGGAPLPIALDVIGATGCSLLTSIDATQPAQADGQGTISGISLQVPADPALVGTEFFEQVFVLDAAANALGVVTTSAYAVVIGS